MVKLTNDEIKCITAFEQLSGAVVKDCIIDGDSILFLIKEGDMGRAIGKNGSTIERARKAFKKNLHVAEHAEKAEKLIENLLFPIPVINLNIQDKNDKKVAFVYVDERDRGTVIGRNGEKIKIIKTTLDRYFKLELRLLTHKSIN